MTVLGTVLVTATVADDAAVQQSMAVAGTIADVVGQAGQRQTIAISSGFNAITVPTGAKCVVIRIVSGAVTLTLKGITGDTGTELQSGTLTTIPIVLPLGTTPSLGITADGSASIDVMFL